MNEIQHPGVHDLQRSWLFSRDDQNLQVRPAHRTASSNGVKKQTRNKERLTAAILYLVAIGFFGLIMAVLATTWGKDGFNQILAEGNVARPAVVYMLVAGGYFLAASILLFLPLSLPQPLRIALLAPAFMLMLAGFIFAPPAAVVGMVPLWFLFKFHQEVTPQTSFDADAQQQGSPAASGA